MPWEDFEHLVGGLFEKMFNVHSGEVKVTKASRDGRIDIIIFNPDLFTEENLLSKQNFTILLCLYLLSEIYMVQ